VTRAAEGDRQDAAGADDRDQGQAGWAGARWLGPAVACTAVVAAPLVYLPSLDSIFSAPKLAVLTVAGAAGLGSHLMAAAAGLPRLRWWSPLALAALALLGTTALAAAIAVPAGGPSDARHAAPYAVDELTRLAAVLGVAAAAAQAAGQRRWRRRLCDAIHTAAGVVSLVGVLQHLGRFPFPIPNISVPGSTFGNRNFGAELVAMSLPFAIGSVALAWRARRASEPWGRLPVAVAAALLLLQVAYLAVARTRGAWIGGLLGVAAFLALSRPRLSRRRWLVVAVAAGGAVLAAAAIPARLAPRDALDSKRYAPGLAVLSDAVDPQSPVARTRLGLWRRTLALYAERPLTGIGPGNFPVHFPRKAEPGAAADGVLTPRSVPRHAHQDLLERLAETGPLGLGALVAVFAVAGAVAAGRCRRARAAIGVGVARAGAGTGRGSGAADESDGDAQAELAPAAAGSLAALLGAGLTGFPLEMPATALLCGVALGVLAAPSPGVEPARAARSPARVLGAVRGSAAAWLALALVVAATTLSARRLAASYQLGRAEAALARGDRRAGASAALASLERAERAEPGRFDVSLRLAHANLRLDQGAAAAAAARRALAVEPFSPHALAALAAAQLATGDPAAAVASARRALDLLHDFPPALATLARASERAGLSPEARDARAE
jgi:O-antigen ligase